MKQVIKVPADAPGSLGARLRQLRLAENMTQERLAAKSGIPIATYKRLEATGHGTIATFAAATFALGRIDELDGLLTPSPTSDEFERAFIGKPMRLRAGGKKNTRRLPQ